MIDTLQMQLEKAKARQTLAKCDVRPGSYAVVTLHRPSNVDDRQSLSDLVDVLKQTSAILPIVFPVHPRTKHRLEEHGLLVALEHEPNIRLLGPLGYHDFLCLTSQAKVIVTDSGGLQEESTALGVPCLTMRDCTERPITVEMGTSTLIGSSADMLRDYLQNVIEGKYKQGKCPELWDGKAAERIAALIARS
jgi:UDP-N-acetylglucosamine 2-epimerase (non-hydrolysing)